MSEEVIMTEHRTLMQLAEHQQLEKARSFNNRADKLGEPEAIYISKTNWDEMGQPEVITVTVTPADILNHPANTIEGA